MKIKILHVHTYQAKAIKEINKKLNDWLRRHKEVKIIDIDVQFLDRSVADWSSAESRYHHECGLEAFATIQFRSREK